MLHLVSFNLVLLCFALLCFALLCFALLCFALLCFALLNTGDPLHDHRRSRTAAIANSCNAILTRLQLMQQSRQDPRARTS
jgi:hypothetical protein